MVVSVVNVLLLSTMLLWTTGNALGNNPNYLAETSAALLIQPNIGIPPMLGVTRGNERRQQIETEFIAALQAAGIEAVLVDATSLPPLMAFLKGCFE